jgi:glutaredoxin
MGPRVEIYTKADCCLCAEAKAVLERVRADVPFDLVEIDVAADPALLARYGTEIPVVFVAGRKAFKYHVDERELRRRLRGAAA